VALLAAGGLAWRRWRPFRIEIEGRSMVPTLQAGDWALAVRARSIRPGAIVVVEHPGRPGFELVKRVVAGPGDRAPDGHELGADEIWIEGDSPGSIDSRSFGPVGPDAVRGRVIVVWWPPARRRRV
jgi:hypothetical protein